MESSEHEQPNDVDPHADLELVPFVGKEFATKEDAKHFYNNYAYQLGFSVRAGGHYKSSKLQDVSAVRYLCSMEGLPKKDQEAQKSAESSCNQRTPQKTKIPTRTGCKAMMRIRFVEGVWRVSIFREEHNHPLVASPSKKRNLRSHKSMESRDKETINALHAQSIEPAKIHEYLAAMHGGKEFLKFKKKDVSNEIASQNLKFLGVDVDSSLIYFQKKQEEDAEFFYDVEVDESGRLKNLFWVDGRARRAFQEFGDVVSFDTTYQTNKYSMPLALFVGVNHHRMSIFFGMAMLRSEDKAGFVWLFQTWVKAMYGKEAKAIITDQDLAMRIAIKDVLPNTVHRCCQWHVMRKAKEHLGIIYHMKKGFEFELKSVINRSMTVSEFEERWSAMLEKYDLRNNRHLNVMYEKRSEWIPTYFRGVFFANMSTTQRSESANSTLKIWTDNHSSMYQLVLQVEKIVDGIWQKESDEDIRSMSAVFRNSSLYRIEKDAFEVYTCEVMKHFKGILINSQLGKVKEIEKDVLYEVTIDYHPNVGKVVEETYKVKVDISEEQFSCSCKGYDFEGLLCSHAIKIMHHVGILHLPNHYIMKRWCKGANASVKRSKVERSMEFGSTQEQEALRFATLKPEMNTILKMAAKSSIAFSYLQGLLKEAKDILEEMVDEKEEARKEAHEALGSSHVIFDPPISQCKGKRKRPQRFKPPSEAKKPRRCGTCGSTKGGHNSRTCPLKKVEGKKKNSRKVDVDSQEDDDMDSSQEEEDLDSAQEDDNVDLDA